MRSTREFFSDDDLIEWQAALIAMANAERELGISREPLTKERLEQLFADTFGPDDPAPCKPPR